MTISKEAHHRATVALSCREAPHTCERNSDYSWRAQPTYNTCLCMLNKNHFSSFKQQAVFSIHIYVTEHKFKMLYLGLGDLRKHMVVPLPRQPCPHLCCPTRLEHTLPTAGYTTSAAVMQLAIITGISTNSQKINLYKFLCPCGY